MPYFICLEITPKIPLVVAANRDEFYERNTAGISWWPEHPHILAGRDQADVIGSPGTWLGLTKHGRFSALTNVRSPSEKNQTHEPVANFP